MLATLCFGQGQILLEPRETPTSWSLAVSVRRSADALIQELGTGPARIILPRLEKWFDHDDSYKTVGEIDQVPVGNIFNLDNHVAVYGSTKGKRRLFIQNKQLEIILRAELSDDEVKQWRTEIQALGEEMREISGHS
jgi:hypothetical protein